MTPVRGNVFMTRHRKLATFVIFITLALVGGVWVWWHMPGPGRTSIELSGNSGDSFDGFYVQHGKRTHVNGLLPWTFTGSGISEAEFRKTRADGRLTLEARYSKPHGMDAFVSGTVKPEFAGMGVYVHRSGIGMKPVK